MHRRDLLAAGATAGILLATHRASADAPKAEAKKAPPPKPDARQAALDAIAACLAKSLACQAHCEAQLAAGTKEFARCASAVTDMLAIGHAAQSAIARKSALAKKLAEVCAVACKECAAACAEHKPHFAHNMHLECKECLESCEACEKACAAFAAA